jgi:UDPglucose 6-dehydrogenase
MHYLTIEMNGLRLKKASILNIAVLGGTGYVGLTTAVCFASKGHPTFCVGRNEAKIEKIRQGFPIIYEAGLEELLKDGLTRGTLKPTTDLENAVMGSDVSFICVGTPSRSDGSIDLSEIREVSEKIGRALAMKDNYHVVVVRSTVVPGTTEEIVIPNLERLSRKKTGVHFGVCMIPEFLREGQAIKDFLFPRNIGVVIGEYDKRSGDSLFELYKAFDAEIMRTNLRTAEMIKYARNSYLAKDVSFANEIANICQKCGADYLQVKRGMELDARIGKGRFLDAGAGFGGSCFPKDVKAIVAKAKEIGVEPELLKATLEVNELQPLRLVEMAKDALGRLNGKNIAVLGLAFKPGTDDMREAVSIKVVNALLEEGAKVRAYDPQASETAAAIFGDKITYADSAEKALSKADACLIVTEWPEFNNASLYTHMRNKVIIDGRRVLDPSALPPGFVYNSIGFSGPVKT